MLFWEEMRGPLPPPSYPEAINMSAVRSSTPVEEELKPKLCKMEKTATGFGFHLNGILGVSGQFIKEVRLIPTHTEPAIPTLYHLQFKLLTEFGGFQTFLMSP